MTETDAAVAASGDAADTLSGEPPLKKMKIVIDNPELEGAGDEILKELTDLENMLKPDKGLGAAGAGMLMGMYSSDD